MNIDDLKEKLYGGRPDWQKWLIWILIFGAILSGWVWAVAHMPKEKVSEAVIAEKAKEVAKVPTEAVQVKTVVVYKTTPVLKKKLNLPQPVVDDTQQAVLASSKIPAGERAHTVTTVLNTDTGKSETYTRTDPLPWLAYESRGDIGLYYGIKQGQRVTRLQARQDFIQAKALHIGVVGSIDSDRSSFIGFGVRYAW